MVVELLANIQKGSTLRLRVVRLNESHMIAPLVGFALPYPLCNKENIDLSSGDDVKCHCCKTQIRFLRVWKHIQFERPRSKEYEEVVCKVMRIHTLTHIARFRMSHTTTHPLIHVPLSTSRYLCRLLFPLSPNNLPTRRALRNRGCPITTGHGSESHLSICHT